MKNLPFLRRIAAAVLLLAATIVLPLLVTSDSRTPPLAVYSVFPANQSSGVPLGSTIEVEFTAPPQAVNQYFELSPAAAGRFTYEGNKVIFLPTALLEENTAYTVTIKAGLRPRSGSSSLPDDVVFRFITETREFQPPAMFYTPLTHETVLPIDTPVLDLRSDIAQPGRSECFQVDTYKLDDAKQYLDIIYAANNTPRVSGKSYYYDRTPLRTNTSELDKIGSFEQEIVFSENYIPCDIIFPEPLPEGWYLIDAAPVGENTTQEQHVQKVVQVSSIAAYHQTHNGEALLWLNSTAGEVLPGAELSVYINPSDIKPESVHTLASDGTAIFSIPELEHPDLPEDEPPYDPRYYIMQTPAGGQFAEVIADTHSEELSDRQKYYAYLYTDREIYRQGDTIKFWGVLRPRRDDVPPVTNAYAYLDQSWMGFKTAETALTVLPDGTFSGELSYDALVSGYYSINLSLQSDPQDYWSGVYSKSVRISAYEKPVYTLAASTDKEYYFADEAVGASFAVNFFDGTPAPGIEMVPGEYAVDGAATLLTSSTGKISAKFDPALALEAEISQNYTLQYSWQPFSMNVGASNAGAEQQNFTSSKNVTVFPSRVMLRTELQENLTSNSITVYTNKIDLSKLQSGATGDYWSDDYANITGAPCELPLVVTVKKRTWTKTPGTPYYNPYLKQSFPRWYYNSAESVHQVIETTTKNGVLQLDHLPKSRPMEHYWVDVEAVRPKEENATLIETVHLGAARDFSNTNQDQPATKRHTFDVATSYVRANSDYYYYNSTYNFNDNISFELLENNLPLEQQQGKVLYNLLQDKIIRHGIGNGVSGSFVADEPTLPNFSLCGAYFDGTRIYPVVPFELNVNEQSRALALSVTSDQQSYKPGDTAEVTLSLLNQDGQPVPDARVCLGVVDEAIFALEPQETTLLWSLFRSVYYSYPQVYATYRQRPDVYYDQGGKGGGGGGDESAAIREKFKDTVDVYTGLTDSGGTARFSFTVPDNLTSWRLTGLALSPGNYAAETKSNVFSSLPFFVQPIFNSRYLEGDGVSFTLRSFGSGAKTGEPVQYTVDIMGANGNATLKKSANIGDYATFTAENLPAGAYTATIQAVTSGYSDAVRHSFEVVTGALEVPVTQTFALADGISVKPLRYPVDVYLYNDDYKHYMRAVRTLQRDWYSNRADTAIANKAVRQSLQNFYGDDWDVADTFNLGTVQTFEGGVKLFPYAEPDAETTAKACVASNGSIDTAAAGQYLKQFENNSFAYLGLAALGEDNTALIKQKLALKSTPLKEQLTLISALSYTDKPAALSLYQEKIAPQLSAKDLHIVGKSTEKVLWLAGKTTYNTIELTSAAMMSSLLTGAADTESLLAFLYDGYRQNYWNWGRGPSTLECALYINRFVPKNASPTVVTYLENGKTVTKTVEKTQGLRLSLNKAQLDALDLKLQSGGGFAEVSYIGTPDETGYQPSPNITVDKSIQPVGDAVLGGEVEVSITVSLAATAPGGCYTVTEWIPSNLRFRSGDKKHYANVEGQLMSYSLWLEAGKTTTVTYRATLALETNSIVESTYVFHDDTMEGARTERDEFNPF